MAHIYHTVSLLSQWGVVIFILITRTNFGRAARRIGIAQPPLSQQIAVLERKLGTRLFVRTSRQVQLTPAGVALLQEARKILSHAERVPQVVAAAAAGQSGTLSVGFFPHRQHCLYCLGC